MSHNKSKAMQRACYLIDAILGIDLADPHALPGSAVSHLKDAKRILKSDIRKRRDGRVREVLRRS